MVNTAWGVVRAPMVADYVIVGDRLWVPPIIEVEFPGTDGQPAFFMVIEVIEGVPRCTELTLRRHEGGREIRQRDLRAIELDSWIEGLVAKVSFEIMQNDEKGVAGAMRVDPESLRSGIKTISGVRKGSRRPLTGERRQRVAEVYNAHETGGIEAVELAFNVSRSTAVRYIKAARDAGLIETRKGVSK